MIVDGCRIGSATMTTSPCRSRRGEAATGWNTRLTEADRGWASDGDAGRLGQALAARRRCRSWPGRPGSHHVGHAPAHEPRHAAAKSDRCSVSNSPTIRRAKRYSLDRCRLPEVDLCITDPGFEVDVFVTTDSRTMTWVCVWRHRASRCDRAKVSVDLHGPRDFCRAVPLLDPPQRIGRDPRRRPLRTA